jgi:adenylate kinase family enzyme
VVTNRVAVYLRDTLPVIERYAHRGIMWRIDGNQPIVGVEASLRQAISADQPILA